VSALPGDSEWREGWRIVLGCALASGSGIVLLFFTFNLFVLPLAAELNVTRGEIGTIQALIVTSALGAPLVGRAADIWGFKPVYLICTGLLAGGQIVSALFASTLTHLAISIAMLGFVGVGSTAVVTTRPVNAHFVRYRGRALGLVAVGVSITAFIAPLLLQPVIDLYGWRGGFLGLAAFSVAVGIPAAALIVPAAANQAHRAAHTSIRPDWTFLGTRDFALMALAIVAMGVATAGFVGQLSPMIQSEGFAPEIGALALSVFAAGQFVGRLGGGWLLDKFRPQTVAVVLTIVPGCGFLLLALTDQLQWAAILAAGMIGLQQGAELDLFAYFVARRFPLAQYGTVYGALNGISWIGNGIGIVGVGLLYDGTGSYDLGQVIGMAALVLGAVLVGFVRLPALQPVLARASTTG
jgi:predicted MFS family arabinose efflux permease